MQLILQNPDEDQDLLYAAVNLRNLDAVKRLLERRPDLLENTACKTNPTADRPLPLLSVAIITRADDIAAWLVDVKAVALVDEDYSALHLAAEYGAHRLIPKLVTAGADPNAKNKAMSPPIRSAKDYLTLKALLDAGADPNSRYAEHGDPVILEFVPRDDVTLLEALLESGADPNAATRAGDTALHAVRYTKEDSEADALYRYELLLRHGADIAARGENGKTVLHHVPDDPRAVMFLVTKNADIDAVDDNGYTPLTLAVMHGHIKSAKMLVAMGANVLAKSANGLSPLELVTERAGGTSPTPPGGQSRETVQFRKLLKAMETAIKDKADERQASLATPGAPHRKARQTL